MKIAYVNVFVGDLSRTLAFDKDTLGLDIQFSSPEHGYASISAGNVRLGLAVPGKVHHASDEATLGRIHGPDRRPRRQHLLS